MEKQKGLILTMGLSPEPLIFTIKMEQAKFVVFIGTNDSFKKSVDRTIEETGLKPSQYHKFEIKDDPNLIGSLCEQFQFAKEWLEKQGVKEVIADPTGGRKWMSAGAVMAASFLGIKMLYVDAKYESGKILLDTMQCIELGNAYDQTGFILSGKARDDFNGFDYEGASIHFNSIKPSFPHKRLFFEGLANVCAVLARWDRFEHYGLGISEDLLSAANQVKVALKAMPEDLKWAQFVDSLQSLSKTLSSVEGKDEVSAYFIADLYLNAERCYLRNRFDDSLARQYRTLEALSQYLLSTYGISTTNPDYTLLHSEMLPYFTKYCRGGNLPDKLDLKLSYWLLFLLDHPVRGLVFGPKQDFKNFIFEKLLLDRNSSILAHGFRPIGKQKASDFLGKLKDILKVSLGTEFDEIIPKLQVSKMPELGF